MNCPACGALLMRVCKECNVTRTPIERAAFFDMAAILCLACNLIIEVHISQIITLKPRPVEIPREPDIEHIIAPPLPHVER